MRKIQVIQGLREVAGREKEHQNVIRKAVSGDVEHVAQLCARYTPKEAIRAKCAANDASAATVHVLVSLRAPRNPPCNVTRCKTAAHVSVNAPLIPPGWACPVTELALPHARGR